MQSEHRPPNFNNYSAIVTKEEFKVIRKNVFHAGVIFWVELHSVVVLSAGVVHFIKRLIDGPPAHRGLVCMNVVL